MEDTGFVLLLLEILFFPTRINLFPGLLCLRPCSLLSMCMKTALSDVDNKLSKEQMYRVTFHDTVR